METGRGNIAFSHSFVLYFSLILFLNHFHYGIMSQSSSSPPNSPTHTTMSTLENPKPEDNPHHPASPYFIQPGENASSPLVPELLTTKNYITWSRSMRRALNIKNKLGFLESKISKPLDSDPLFLPWERCNDMIIAWLQNSVGPDLRPTIAHAETAAEVWSDLRERFSIKNAPRIFQLTKAVSSLTQDTDSVSIYYNKLKGYWDELEVYEPMPLCTCGSVKALMEYHHCHKVMQFLMGLQDSYDAIRAQILLSDPLPSLNRVFSLIQQEERRWQLHYAPTPAPTAMVTRGLDPRLSSSSRKERLYCSHCNISGHSLERCFKANPNLPVCSHCCIPGHTKDKCYRLNGYPSSHKNGPKSKYIANIVSLEQEQNHNGSPITQEQYSKLLALLQPSSSSTIDNTPAAVNQAQLLHSPTMSGPFNFDDDWEG
ncbi:uncharacterized protein LOC122313306 [Carya illinoinensis]|uniref:uncharacterized protein LOC122313306 n=1 Tax=Carya illinoinensis TaxID=32201 RepID=UPI001C7269C2|nr:uncharacterized protein LOC122313306 [Carya illinoinensis]